MISRESQSEGIVFSDEYLAAFRTAAIVQVIVGILAALMLDSGDTLRAFPFALLCQWIVTVLIVFIRPLNPKRLHLALIKYGIIPFLFAFTAILPSQSAAARANAQVASRLNSDSIAVFIDPTAAPRIEFGAGRLVDSLKAAGLEASLVRAAPEDPEVRPVIVGTVAQEAVKERLDAGQFKVPDGGPGKEGFALASCSDGTLVVAGGDDSGALYGCLELAERVRKDGKLPEEIHFADKPAFTLRGPCIGMQKTTILPGRRTYEYPYTPELFPFFYDKAFWQDYLDMLVENRMNTLYLWNGHPFASLVKLDDYPYALEVPDDVFEKNVEMYRYIAEECDKRGIWLVQMFYSLLVSKPFAEHNGMETQLARSNPLAADYTRKSIAEFVKQYPNVGLLVCLGEALQGVENQTPFFCETVLPGVMDGMKEAGLTEPPPVVLRAHATDPSVVMPAALKVYQNLYTMAKYNGESLTTWEPRGRGQQVHLAMSRLGSSHMVNVHLQSNLEPFRYGAQRFIQKCVVASRDRLGARGVHLYPLFYWNWPDSPDAADPPLKQTERDWIWFEAWARYCWNPDVDPTEDREYWIDRLTDMYGRRAAAEYILDAYNDSGECAPRLVRRFGITEGNRQTLSLGMTLDQLVHPERYGPFPDLWQSQSPPGERLQEYALKEWNHEPHEGETPPQIIDEVLDYSAKAVRAIDDAAPHVTRNREEFARLRNDIHAIRAMCEHYAEKVEAAMLVLRYQYSRDLADLEQAAEHLEKSVAAYERLTALTDGTYRYANSLQTGHRRIPYRGFGDGHATYYHWTQVLPQFRQELADFRAKIEQIRVHGDPSLRPDESDIEPWPAVSVRVLSPGAETYTVRRGARPFADRGYAIVDLAPELEGLTGIRFSHEQAKWGRYQPIEFEVTEPVQVLVGYFQDDREMWLQVPNPDFAAHADERGGLEPVIRNAAIINSSPGVNVHAFRFDAGRQKLELIGKGSFVVLGVVPQSAELKRRDAGRGVGK